MKRKIVTSTKFRKDFKLACKSKTFNVDTFENVISKLVTDIPLDEKYKDHSLHGDMKAYRDCHIHSDWVLIYDMFERTLLIARNSIHYSLYIIHYELITPILLQVLYII